MMEPQDRYEEVQEELNPHRREELERANAHVIDTLQQRGVRLEGTESSDELADLLSAVERFERVVEARGGDTMTNTPDSSSPDNPAFVLPERRPGESARDYVARIVRGAEALTTP